MTQRAMACDFSVILNGGAPKECIPDLSGVLDLVADLEQQMSVYKSDSEITRLNQVADIEPFPTELHLFRLLQQSATISGDTEGAFDPTSGPLVSLWRMCRESERIPNQEEIDKCLEIVGVNHVQFHEQDAAIQFDRAGVELNLGGIGKGYALDRVADRLHSREIDHWLLHGGQSSLMARGSHHRHPGWPVGIGNPLFTGKRLGTILLCDRAMATSGSNIQYFRHQGQKYGHILDPRTGWPVESMLSVTVLADSAAEADALSTALYVMGVEKAKAYCDNVGLGAVLIPFPKGRQLDPIVVGIPEELLFLDEEQLV